MSRESRSGDGASWQKKRAKRTAGPPEGRYRQGDEPYGTSESPRAAHRDPEGAPSRAGAAPAARRVNGTDTDNP